MAAGTWAVPAREGGRDADTRDLVPLVSRVFPPTLQLSRDIWEAEATTKSMVLVEVGVQASTY